jgi:hypothetical protein
MIHQNSIINKIHQFKNFLARLHVINKDKGKTETHGIDDHMAADPLIKENYS